MKNEKCEKYRVDDTNTLANKTPHSKANKLCRKLNYQNHHQKQQQQKKKKLNNDDKESKTPAVFTLVNSLGNMIWYM